MGKLIGELIFGLVRFLVAMVMESLLMDAAKNLAAWLDPEIRGRYTKFIVGGLLGIPAYLLFPIVMGLF